MKGMNIDMNSRIQSKSDFLTGSFLVTRIPEDELDRNAFYTTLADCPDFILPFHHKSIEGQIEFVYQIGTHNKLQYFTGSFTPKEYSELWVSIINPLLECGDWFMNPCSFILDVDYLYFDKKRKTVSYVYIPSTRGCSGYDAFKEMAADVVKLITVTDAVLENKVLRSIMKDFNPNEFLKMLREYIAESKPAEEKSEDPEQQPEREFIPLSVKESGCAEESNEPDSCIPDSGVEGVSEDTKESPDGFIISIPLCKDEQIKEKEHSGRKKEKDSGGYKVFGGWSGRKRELRQEDSQNIIQLEAPEQEADKCPMPVITKQAEVIDITQSTPVMMNGTGLRYVGRAHLPQAIQIKIAEGEIFTIGRFDANIGRQQSSFEFDKKTKAVSRRHAVIERGMSGYNIIDLSSSAGTYVNDRKLPPNTPYGLETGCRVSFGNSGADYVWEVS